MHLKKLLPKEYFPEPCSWSGGKMKLAYEQAFGSRSLVPAKAPMQVSTIFDLASLTKPLATTIATMLLVREKKDGAR